LLLGALLLLAGGCLWPVRYKTDQAVAKLSSAPFDVAPALAPEPLQQKPTAAEQPAIPAKPAGKSADLSAPATDIQTTALMQAAPEGPFIRPQYKLEIPSEIPGSEVPLIDFTKPGPKKGERIPMTPQEKLQTIRKLYPPLPPLPTAPTPQPGPNGRPYTLADFQQLAVENSPTLRQAASDVQAARGNLLQALAYPNPTVSYLATPSNNGSTAAVQGVGFDQVIKTFGKLKIAGAAAQKALDNAELALRRARSDLSTNVRNAYFGLIVAYETMRVSRGLARFTDEVYRVYEGYLEGGFAASYEPASLRASAYTARLAYQQAISGYLYAWKQLVATLGLPQLPLSEVAGRVDRLIPYYDYDAVLARALNRHTDILTARNSVEIGRYNLRAAQIAPYPDVDVNIQVFKELALSPNTIVHTVNVGVPIPLWDRNKGNIIAAQAALIRAEEEEHRVAVTITNNLAAAYLNYKNNLDALEYYRRFILPDQVRAYRGTFERRQTDPLAAFGDLVAAQQALATGVTTYLGILGTLWSGVVSVADFLQTDDLFQQAQPRELPELPDLEQLPRWVCPHGRLGEGGPQGACAPPSGAPAGSPAPIGPLVPAPAASGPAVGPELPAPRRLEAQEPPDAPSESPK
jgi:cobalt-zinc-cadmium efflux system outer membrane protein